MTEHLSECPILKPCCDDEEFPEHGFCGNFVGGRCLHCMAECICDELRACEDRVLNAAREAVVALCWRKQYEGFVSTVDPQRVLAAIDALKEGK